MRLRHIPIQKPTFRVEELAKHDNLMEMSERRRETLIYNENIKN